MEDDSVERSNSEGNNGLVNGAGEEDKRDLSDHSDNESRKNGRSSSLSSQSSLNDRKRSVSHSISDDHRSKHRSSSRNSRRRSRSNSYRRKRERTYSRSRSRSRSRSSGRGGGRSRGDSRGRYSNRENPEPSKIIGVFGLSNRTGRRELEDVFSKYGRVDKVDLIIDHRTGDSRGFAFIYYYSLESAISAREKSNGMSIDGRNIRTDFSVTKRPHKPTPGIYMGKRTERYRGDFDRRRDDYGDRYSSRRRYDDDRSYRRRSSPESPRRRYRSVSRSRSHSRHYRRR